MRLGRQEIALVQFDVPGRPYPAGSRSDDLWFEHLAIAVGDMDAAHANLSARSDWCAISEDGPQLLPPANGAVRAFKFRDPDGHPLELLWFPPGQGRAVWQRSASPSRFLGIDHSALSVASTPDSLVFYRALGLMVAATSVNQGAAQAAWTRCRARGCRSAAFDRTRPTALGWNCLATARPAGAPAQPARTTW